MIQQSYSGSYSFEDWIMLAFKVSCGIVAGIAGLSALILLYGFFDLLFTLAA